MEDFQGYFIGLAPGNVVHLWGSFIANIPLFAIKAFQRKESLQEVLLVDGEVCKAYFAAMK